MHKDRILTMVIRCCYECSHLMGAGYLECACELEGEDTEHLPNRLYIYVSIPEWCQLPVAETSD